MNSTGPAILHERRALVLYAPNTTRGVKIMEGFAQSVSCPEDPLKKSRQSYSFFELFRQPLAVEECALQADCMTNPKCSSHLKGKTSPASPSVNFHPLLFQGLAE